MSDLLESVRDGERLWPWDWAKLARRDDAATLDAVRERLLGSLPEPPEGALLRALTATAQRALGVVRLREHGPLLATLALAMTRETLHGAVLAMASIWRHDQYLAIFRAVGAAALEPLRAVLDGPPAGVSYSASQDGFWAVFGGPKVVALQVVAEAGDPSDHPRWARLAGALDEPPAIRAAAALVRAVADPAEARANLGEALLAIPGDRVNTMGEESYWGRLAQLAAAGPVLIPVAVECLVGDDWVLRKRASELLCLLGEPAREPVGALGRRTDDWRVKQACEQITATLALHAAFRKRQPSDRSLSRAPRHRGADDGALSPADPPAD